MGAHINHNGEFQSDKYPLCPPGKVPLSTKDPMAQDLLAIYATRRLPVDGEFSDDVRACLESKGFNVEDFYAREEARQEILRIVIDKLKFDLTPGTGRVLVFDHMDADELRDAVRAALGKQ